MGNVVCKGSNQIFRSHSDCEGVMSEYLANYIIELETKRRLYRLGCACLLIGVLTLIGILLVQHRINRDVVSQLDTCTEHTQQSVNNKIDWERE